MGGKKEMTEINLYGRVLIHARIEAFTGLHIGASSSGLEIGGVDNTIIRSPLDGIPYIPGSSLRGKMRSQTEKVLGLSQNNKIGQAVKIHTCETSDDYHKNGGCPVCFVFGVPAEKIENAGPTRLAVRDTPMSKKSVEDLDKAHTELSYAELKTEVAIDRVTSAATPRTLERVPAGAIFAPAELVFGIYEEADFERIKVVVNALQLVEDDYLGGAGSRGSGKVRFSQIQIFARNRDEYGKQHYYQGDSFHFASVQQVSDAFNDLSGWLRSIIRME